MKLYKSSSRCLFFFFFFKLPVVFFKIASSEWTQTLPFILLGKTTTYRICLWTSNPYLKPRRIVLIDSVNLAEGVWLINFTSQCRWAVIFSEKNPPISRDDFYEWLGLTVNTPDNETGAAVTIAPSWMPSQDESTDVRIRKTALLTTEPDVELILNSPYAACFPALSFNAGFITNFWCWNYSHWSRSCVLFLTV